MDNLDYLIIAFVGALIGVGTVATTKLINGSHYNSEAKGYCILHTIEGEPVTLPSLRDCVLVELK